MEIEISLPQGYTKKGNLIVPQAIKFGSNGTTVFETDFTCAQSISGAGGGKAIVKVTYQTCNDQVCLPPETKEFQITLY
jgi:thiol:disulfide interchange protein